MGWLASKVSRYLSILCLWTLLAALAETRFGLIFVVILEPRASFVDGSVVAADEFSEQSSHDVRRHWMRLLLMVRNIAGRARRNLSRRVDLSTIVDAVMKFKVFLEKALAYRCNELNLLLNRNSADELRVSGLRERHILNDTFLKTNKYNHHYRHGDKTHLQDPSNCYVGRPWLNRFKIKTVSK